MSDLINLPCRDEEGHNQVIIEAPRGSLIKLKYDPLRNTFVLKRLIHTADDPGIVM